LINLHAVWVGGIENKLHLWAESFDMLKSMKEINNISEASTVAKHPFSVESDLLCKEIHAFTKHKFIKNKNYDSLEIFLPSNEYIPIPSSSKSHGVTFNIDEASQIKSWTVSTISFSKEDILNLFYRLNRRALCLSTSNSFNYYISLSTLSTDLMLFKHVLPSINELKTEENGNVTYSSNWNVNLSKPIFNKINILANSMPYSFGATTNIHNGKNQSFDIVLNFLNHSIDSYIKFNLLNKKILPSRRGRRPKTLPTKEKWFESLTKNNSRFVVKNGSGENSLISFKNYTDDLISINLSSIFKIGFKLAPLSEIDDVSHMDDENSKWLLNFYLRSIIDGSIIDANDLWDGRSNIELYNIKRDDIKEQFLTELNRASSICPIIEDVLFNEYPTELLLDTDDAYLFLSQYVNSLREEGFSILLPSWWKKDANRIAMKLKIKSEGVGSGLMGMDSIIEYDWKIALGNDIISIDEFEKLVKSKLPLVKIKDQWVEFKPHEIKLAQKFFKKNQKKNTMQLKEALSMGLGEMENEFGIQVTGIEGDGWVGDFLDKFKSFKKNKEITTIKVPSTFNGILRQYQEKGVSWLAFLNNFKFGACLADDMGLGKTIQLIALLLHDKENDKTCILPTLIIGPMSILGNWQREFEKFAPSISVLIHHGPHRLKETAFKEQAENYSVVITTYSLAHKDKDSLSKIQWGRIVLDEAQNIKNPSTKQTQAIKSLQSTNKIAMTGTPVENRLTELWSIMEFLNPGYLGNIKEFRKTFATPIEKYNDATQSELLKQLVQPFILRRLKTDKKIIGDLPDKIELKVFCNLTKEQASIYEAVVENMLEKIESTEGIERKGLVLATLMKLKQVCNHPAQFAKDNSQLQSRSGKLIRLEEMVEESLSEGDGILIFTQFKEMGFILKKRLQDKFKCEIPFLYGGTKKKNRDIMIQQFQDNVAEKNIFILSLKAGGIGINLTSANRVFHYDRWWNPAVEDQATDRAYRIGQKENVQVHKFVCMGTLEERIDGMIEQKKNLADKIIHSGQDWITEMSTDKLKSLFKLNRNAVM
jgi:SNF2 family DNA or RNA helicase